MHIITVDPAHICHHAESDQEPEDGHAAYKDLLTVPFTQVLWVQVHDGGHKSFHANKLKEKTAC